VLVWGAADYLAARPRWKNISLSVAGGALAGCAIATAIQISYWHDNVRLFRRAMEVSPDNYIAANCLGKAYEKLGDNAHALVLYKLSVEAEPRYPQSQLNYAMSLLSFGDRAGGLEHLQAAAGLEPHNPDIQFDLGVFFAQQSNWTNALQHFRNALAIRPNFPAAQAQCDNLLSAHRELN